MNKWKLRTCQLLFTQKLEFILWNNQRYGKYDIPYAYAAENTIFQDLVPGKVEYVLLA